MPALRQTLPASLVSGAIANIATMAALALLARAEGRAALQPINATSHWLHGEKAGKVTHADAPHTLVGYLTNHAASTLWAFTLEAWLDNEPHLPAAQVAQRACAVSVVAAVVDYGLTPNRFTPGWEEAVSWRSIGITYVALAAGLTAGALVTQQMR